MTPKQKAAFIAFTGWALTMIASLIIGWGSGLRMRSNRPDLYSDAEMRVYEEKSENRMIGGASLAIVGLVVAIGGQISYRNKAREES